MRTIKFQNYTIVVAHITHWRVDMSWIGPAECYISAITIYAPHSVTSQYYSSPGGVNFAEEQAAAKKLIADLEAAFADPEPPDYAKLGEI